MVESYHLLRHRTMRSQLIIGLIIFVTVASKETEVKTQQDLVAQYFPFHGTIRFKVKTDRDATTILVGKLPLDINTDPYMEIGIGGSSNTVSWIRRRRWADGNIKVETPGILKVDEFRGFWIKLTPPATFTVGKENESLPFLYWTDPNPFKISHFGVATCCGTNTGEWKVQEDEGENSVGTLPKKKKYIRPTNEQVSNWDEAKASCEREGHKLATVRNEKEQTLLEKAIMDFSNPISGVWLAANDRAQHTQFVWQDGSNDDVTFTNWQDEDTPSHHKTGKNCVFASYVALVVQNKASWFVQSCSDLLNFLCESFE